MCYFKCKEVLISLQIDLLFVYKCQNCELNDLKM